LRQSSAGSLGNKNDALSSYVVYINENCCVELSVLHSASSVQNLILETLKKLQKSPEELSEYCLVEQTEYELLINENLNTTSTSNNTNLVNNKNAQSTHTTGTLSTTHSSYIKTNSSSLSGSTSATAAAANTKPKSITKTRVLNSTDNLFMLTKTWNKLKLAKKDGFKQAKVILVKKRALQASQYVAAASTGGLSLNSSRATHSSAQYHSKISASFAKVAAKSSNLHNILSASLASAANLSYFTSSAGPLSSKASEVTCTNSNSRTKSSANRLVRQKSFDESYDTLNNEKLKHKRDVKVSSAKASYNKKPDIEVSKLSQLSAVQVPPPLPPSIPLLSALFKPKSKPFGVTQSTSTSSSTAALKNISEIENESKSKLTLDVNQEDDDDEFYDDENEFDDDYQLIQAGDLVKSEQTDRSSSKMPHQVEEEDTLATAAATDTHKEPSELLEQEKDLKSRSTLSRLFNMRF
jgi:hypothetical protein